MPNGSGYDKIRTFRYERFLANMKEEMQLCRGVHTFINDIRRQVFTEVARMAFEGGNYAETIRRLPHKIIPGEVAKYRQNILVERLW